LINPRDIKVLIAEDEPDLRDLLAAKFRVFGFNVMTAHSGNMAWDKVLENSGVQIVVTDIRMPNGSGYELLQKCKQKDSEFPRVFLISGFTDYTVQELMALGSEGFISKPFDTKDLLNIVRKSLLNTSDRWRAQNADTPEFKLELEFPSLEKSTQNGYLLFGRGGFSAKIKTTLPDTNTLIQFHLNANPWTLQGTGIIRWKSPSDLLQPSEYVGLEIVSLDGPSSTELIEWLETQKPKAFIPSPL